MHLYSVGAYMASSFMIVIFNKIVLTIFEFKSVPFIMFCQSIFTMFIFLFKLDTIQMPQPGLLKVCLLNILNIFFGMNAAANINIAMFSALRRLSILMTLIGQWIVLSKTPTYGVIFSVMLMIFGAVVAATDDLSFNIHGYVFVTINNILTAMYQIETKRAILNNWTKTSILFWSSFLSSIVFGLQLIKFEPSSFDAWDNGAFRTAFFFSICLGFIINWSASWTIEMNDSLTLAMAGSTKSAILGLIVCMGLFDKTYVFTWWNFTGLQISAVASICYVCSIHKAGPANEIKNEIKNEIENEIKNEIP